MESGNQTSDVDSDEDQNIVSFSKLSLHPPIDTDKENEGKKLAKLLKRYTENKEKLIRNAIDLNKVSSILRREKRQTICFGEYSKLDEQQGICKIVDNKHNSIKLHLPQEINTMKKLSKYSVEKLEYLRIRIESHCENEHENIEEFLLSFNSTQINEIIFYGHSSKIENKKYYSKAKYYSYFEVYPCSDYFYGLRDVMSKATKHIWIYRILLNSEEFSAIVRAAKHVEKLHFTDCKILPVSKCELGEMEGCLIEFLCVGFNYDGYEYFRDYNNSCMKIFLSILGCPNLLRSLKQIKFGCREEIKKRLLSKAKEILGNDFDIIMSKFEG